MIIPKDMAVGSVHNTKLCGGLVVVDYVNARDVTVKFIKTGYTTKTQSVHVRSGGVKDYLAPVVYGVGVVGVGDFNATKNRVATKVYQTWHGMLERCYCDKYLVKCPTYIDCTVCDEWLNFQVFAEWFEVNYIEGFQLDKDIKIKGNKIYSPDTCLFVSQTENSIEARAKAFAFVSPIGEVVFIYNLLDFCRKNGLSQGNMSMVNSGVRRSHKGWKKA